MQPKPWSFSSLDDFVNCPRAYHAKRVEKSVVESESVEMQYGTYVHAQFEHRQRHGAALDPTLLVHEELHRRLERMPGVGHAEQKVALNRRGTPTTFFAKDVWWRGIVDYVKLHGSQGLVLDYKTGKPHQKYGQLKLTALYLFAAHPELDTVRAEFYWTKTRTFTGATYTRDMSSALWAEFIPNLKQYVEAFRSDTWQPRPSGLCGWCPVKDCEFWRPRPPGR